MRAHVCDIGPKGLTVLASPLLPRVPHYTLRCKRPGGALIDLQVREVQRILVSRGNKVFLRLGLRVLEGNPLLLLEPTTETPLLEEDPEILMGARVRKRIAFQLPATLGASDQSYRCRTLDMDENGLALAVPADLPIALEVFDLWFTDPSGQEVALLVQQKNRLPLPDVPNEDRLGVQVISGVRAYRNFLRRYATSDD